MNDLHTRRVRRRAGFTLVELMISIIAGTITIAAAYSLGKESARNFNDQMRVTETQNSLRSAADQLRRDVTRAGFLATPEVNLQPSCLGLANEIAPAAYAARLRGLAVGRNASKTMSPSSEPSLESLLGLDVRVDAISMLGNYVDGDMYKITSDSSGQMLTFETARESFRRSFFRRSPTTGGADTFDLDHYNEVFRQGRLVRIDSDGYVFFRQVTSRTADSITLDQAIPQGCFKPATALVTPLSFIEYSVEVLSGADFSRLNAATTARIGSANKAVLVRRELDYPGGTRTPRTTRVVLDYAVEFEANYMISDGAGGFRVIAPQTDATFTTAYTGRETLPTTLRVTLSARNEDVRASDITATAPREDRGTLVESSPLLGTPVKVDAKYARGRVRTLRQEFFLPNMRF